MNLDDNAEVEKGNGGCQMKAEGVPLLDALKKMQSKAADSDERRTWREQYDTTKFVISSQLRRLPTPVLVDCNEFARTHAGGHGEDVAAFADCHLHCLQLGVRLVITESASLNAFAAVVRATEENSPRDTLPSLKKIQSAPSLGSSPLQRRNTVSGIMSLRPERGAEILKQRERLLRYDSCIAADIPLLPAIRSRLQSGSRLRVVQCLLSSSIGLILDMMGRQGKTLREAVEFADNEQIMENFLRDDLLGYDVLAKLNVIAFALGWELPEANVRRVPLVPEADLPDEAQDGIGRQQVFEALDKFDQRMGFSKKASEVHKSGRRLRYIATIELRSSKFARADISLEEVDEDHFTFPITKQEIGFALFDEPPVEWMEKERCRKRTEEAQPGIPRCGSPTEEAWGEMIENSGIQPSPLVLRGPGTGYAHGIGALSDVVRLVKNTV
jgi:homoserine dehydrogenase